LNEQRDGHEGNWNDSSEAQSSFPTQCLVNIFVGCCIRHSFIAPSLHARLVFNKASVLFPYVCDLPFFQIPPIPLSLPNRVAPASTFGFLSVIPFDKLIVGKIPFYTVVMETGCWVMYSSKLLLELSRDRLVVMEMRQGRRRRNSGSMGNKENLSSPSLPESSLVGACGAEYRRREVAQTESIVSALDSSNTSGNNALFPTCFPLFTE